MKELKTISYKYNPNFFWKLTEELSVFSQRMSTLVFFALTILLSVMLARAASLGYLWFSVYILCFVVGMWMAVFLRIIQAALIYSRYMKTIDNKERIFHLDEDKGFGFESKYSSGWFSWDEFTSIKETRCFFLLYFHDGVVRVIGKKTLPEETIIAIRDILKKTPVERKRLREYS